MRARLIGLGKLATAAALGATLVGGAAAYGASAAPPEPANLDLTKSAVEDFYGDRVDSAGHHHASPGSPWDRDTSRAVSDAQAYLAKRLGEGVRNPAIVLDIDDTSELTYGWEADNHFVFDKAKQHDAINRGEFPPIAQTRALAGWAAQHGVKVYFVTGRGDDLGAVSQGNLANEGFPKPAGAFFKPKDQAPGYLPCGTHCTTVQYKAGTREHIESQGDTIVLNVGDQQSDLTGGHAEKPVKLANPMYFIP